MQSLPRSVSGSHLGSGWNGWTYHGVFYLPLFASFSVSQFLLEAGRRAIPHLGVPHHGYEGLQKRMFWFVVDSQDLHSGGCIIVRRATEASQSSRPVAVEGVSV